MVAIIIIIIIRLVVVVCSTIGTGPFPGVKRPGRGAVHPLYLSAEVMKGQSYTSTHPLGLGRLS